MKKLLLLIFLLLGTITYARTYYVSPNGNNSYPGTLTQPWQTWGWAFDHAIAGDTVYFRGGVYYSSAGNIGGERGVNNGTADNWICFLNYPGETPILDCSLRNAMTYNGYNRGIYIKEVDYIHIKGLQVRNVYQGEYLVDAYGVTLSGCANIILENMVVHNVAGVAYSIEGYHGTIQVINCDAYNMCDSLKTAVYPQPGSPGQNGVGFSYNNNAGTDDAILRYFGCRAWNFSDNGFAGSGAGYVEWDHCWAFNGGELSGDGCGFKTQSGYGITPSLDTARMVKNCIAAANASVGFTPNNNGDQVFNLRQYNCVGYHNGYKPGIGHGSAIGVGLGIMNYYLSTPAPNEMYANNIFYDNEYADVAAYDPYTHSHNSIDTPPGVTVTDDDFLSTDWTEMMNPRKPDGSLPDINFMKLAPTSDLIDAGISVGLPFYGSAPDLGWSETVSGATVPATPVYLGAVIENVTPSRLELIYSLTLANIAPNASAFNVLVNSSSRTVNTVAVSGTRVFLTLSSPVTYGDIVTVAYTKPSSNPLQTPFAGQAASITPQNVTNNISAPIPIYTRSVIENATPYRLEMIYSLTLANILPNASAFNVLVNSSSRTVNTVAVSGTRVFLTLSSPVTYGDIVTVAYTKPSSNPLQTPFAGQAASITPQNVTNNVAALSNQPPLVSIASPTKSNSFIAPATITIEANASDPDGTVSKVEFYQGTVLLGAITSAPFSYTFKDVAEGTYSFTAVAIDNKNAKTTSAPVSVVVEKSLVIKNQLPMVKLSVKGNGKPKKHDNIQIVAEATDPDGSITSVVLKQGDITLVELFETPYVYNMLDIDTGTYVLTAIAVDNLGAVSISSEVTLVVEDIESKYSDIINLYPNPNYGNFTIEFKSESFLDQNYRISVTNLSGSIIYDEVFAGSSSTHYMNLHNISSGTYILMITNGKDIISAKTFLKR